MSESASNGSYGLSSTEANRISQAPSLDYQPPIPRRYRPKIGLIGCGGISEYHLRAYRDLNLDVVAICDRHRDRAEKRRDEFFPDATVLTEFNELLRRDDIEVVDIALHPEQRAAAIEAALHARKHVLSQKPFVLDLDRGQALADLADAKGVRLAVNQNGRWAPHFSYMAAAVRAGIIGEVATIDFTLQWDHTWTAGTVFDQVHHLVLFDFGIHWFDMAAQFMSGRSAERVWASAIRTPFQKMVPPILAHAVIDYPGAQVRINFNGHVQHGQEDRTVICGALGTLRSAGPSLSDQKLVLHNAAGQASVPLTGSWFTSGFQGAMTELLCAIEDQREPTHSARRNLDSLALCFAAIASAETGQPVRPGTARSIVH